MSDDISFGKEFMGLDKISSPTIICGYQSNNLIGALAVNHMIEEMDFKEIGSSQLRDAMPILALKAGKILKPFTLHYNEDKNILIIFILAPTSGIEWYIADMIEKVYRETDAKEILIPDGIAVPDNERLFYISNYCSDNVCKDIESYAKSIKNSVIVGVTPALLMKDMNVLCFFGNLLDSKDTQKGIAATKGAVDIIEGLNKYLGLDINTGKLDELGDQMEKELEKLAENVKQQGKSSPDKAYIG